MRSKRAIAARKPGKQKSQLVKWRRKYRSMEKIRNGVLRKLRPVLGLHCAGSNMAESKRGTKVKL